MPSAARPELEALPDELMFSITKAPAAQNAARLGLLKLPNRNAIETPHYIAAASRGVVPHLSPDNFAKQTDIRGVYMALEDFIERQSPKEPPIYKFNPPDNSSPLRRFTGLSDDSLLVLGARRTPPISCPTSSTPTSISVLTSVGYRQLATKEYTTAAARLRPDILVGPGDIPYGADKVSKKKIDKITDRSTIWMLEHVKARREQAKSGSSEGRPLLYAPLLPVPADAQRWYLEHVVDDMIRDIDGLAVYDACTLEHLPVELGAFPRLAFTEPKNPNMLLREIALGMDIMTVPFIAAVTDAGIALDFSFPVAEDAHKDLAEPKPLGVDMWQSKHAIDLSPLASGCSCYACTNHHRAYLQHLLAAKEMLGWVLLQIHNHHIMDLFFSGIRQSIAKGSLEEDTTNFQRVYEPELPAKTGQGPRVRGYQFRAEGPGQPRKNPPAFVNLNDAQQKLDEADPPTPSANAEGLESQGFATRTS